MLIVGLKIFGLAVIQNTSFSMVSRSRNRDNMRYHIIASVFSNTLWLMTLRELVLADLEIWLAAPYVLGTVIGSVMGAKISMRIERAFGISADGHLKKKEGV